MSINKVLVVIPTFNCRSHVLELLRDILEEPPMEGVIYWVVDNLSSDATFEAAKRFVVSNEMENVFVFQTVQNNSLGGTQKIGFNEAIKSSLQYVAILHGDNQARVQDLHRLISLSRSGKTPISILGSRFSFKSRLFGYSKKRIFGNLMINSIYSLFNMRKLVDLGSGLNLYLVEDLKKIDYMNFGNTLTFNFELILSMVERKMSFRYEPIQWRENGQVSNANNFAVFKVALEILFLRKIGKTHPIIGPSRTYKIRDS